VRELANLVERMAIMFPEKVVDAADLPKKYQHVDLDAYIPEYPEEILERQALNDIFSAGFDDFSEEEPSNQFNQAEHTFGLLPDEGIDLKDFLAELEISLISQALDRYDYVVARAAEVLGVRRTTLVEKMKKYNLNRD
jgi:sigma-54 specific flagellar transcriptional regulator A